MALISSGKAARVRSVHTSCTVSATEYTLYTCPANCVAEVTMLLLVGVTDSPTVDVTWNTAIDSGICHILGGKSIAIGEYIIFTGATLVLQTGDTLKVKATSNSAMRLDAACTVTETFIPIG
jgi:hypothetical protein